MTASMAARFSATNRTRRPCAVAEAMRLAMVWLLPVPGGPWTTESEPRTTVSMTACWLASASRTRNSDGGRDGVEGRPGSTGALPVTDGALCGGVAGDGRHQVVRRQRVGVHLEVRHHRQLRVAEVADDGARA